MDIVKKELEIRRMNNTILTHYKGLTRVLAEVILSMKKTERNQAIIMRLTKGL